MAALLKLEQAAVRRDYLMRRQTVKDHQTLPVQSRKPLPMQNNNDKTSDEPQAPAINAEPTASATTSPFAQDHINLDSENLLLLTIKKTSASEESRRHSDKKLVLPNTQHSSKPLKAIDLNEYFDQRNRDAGDGRKQYLDTVAISDFDQYLQRRQFLGIDKRESASG